MSLKREIRCKKCGSKDLRRKAWGEHKTNPPMKGGIGSRNFNPDKEHKQSVRDVLKPRKFNRVYVCRSCKHVQREKR